MRVQGPKEVNLLLAAVLAVSLTSCIGSSGEADVSETPTALASQMAPSAKEPGVGLGEQVAAAWEAIHLERLGQVHSNAPIDADAFSDLVTEETAEALVDLIGAARGEVAVEFVATEFWTQIDVAAGGDEAHVSDCILVATRPAAQPEAEPTVGSRFWTGVVVAEGDGWRLDGIRVGGSGCVPPELNRELLDAYYSWHEAKNEWWEPPDPDHPRLERVMVAPGLGEMRDLLVEHRRMGIVVRDEHDTENAVVFELGIGTARVSDCYPAASGTLAAYDAETGERRQDLSPEPAHGQVDRTVLDLERTAAGEWKANGWRSTSDSDCTPGGTPYAVAP